MRYLFLDIECGGLDPRCSILQLYGSIWLDNQEQSSIELNIKPDKGPFIVEPKALELTKIDLVRHNEQAITESAAGTKLYQWLNNCSYLGKERDRCIPCGSGIAKDIDKITSTIISRNSWDKFCSFSHIELNSLFSLVKSLGFIPSDAQCGLETMAASLDIEYDESKLHNAKYDTELSIKVFWAMSKRFTYGYPDGR